MLRFLCDENFNNHLLRGLLRRNADLDIVRVQDAGLLEADDPTILAWAAEKDRILLTHDVATVPYSLFRRTTDCGRPVDAGSHRRAAQARGRVGNP